MLCRNGKVEAIEYTEEKKNSVVYESDQMIILSDSFPSDELECFALVFVFSFSLCLVDCCLPQFLKLFQNFTWLARADLRMEDNGSRKKR